MSDEIIEELWRIKDELGRAANYNVQVLARELMEMQAASHEVLVDRSGPAFAPRTLLAPKAREAK
jgi:hypothetical protein